MLLYEKYYWRVYYNKFFYSSPSEVKALIKGHTKKGAIKVAARPLTHTKTVRRETASHHSCFFLSRFVCTVVAILFLSMCRCIR